METKTLRISCAQLSFSVGAIQENKEKILSDYKFISLGIEKEEIRKLWQSNPLVRSKELDATTMKYLSSLITL